MFLAELIVGYTTGSLALIADAFHMLSDVLSQIIALYAIRVGCLNVSSCQRPLYMVSLVS
jgi:Co/Zn/Cd efflux system component